MNKKLIAPIFLMGLYYWVGATADKPMRYRTT